MDHFLYKGGQLFAEDVPVSSIAAAVGTPTYIYSKATLLTHYRRIAEAFAPLKPIICYSIKSCGNLSLVRELVNAGSGMDVTSGGELFRALKGGCDPRKIVFAGVGKTDKEINEALSAGGSGIGCGFVPFVHRVAERLRGDVRQWHFAFVHRLHAPAALFERLCLR